MKDTKGNKKNGRKKRTNKRD